MKTNAKCPVCGLMVCHKCRSHKFPPNPAAIAASDNAHGKKMIACCCFKSQKKKRGW